MSSLNRKMRRQLGAGVSRNRILSPEEYKIIWDQVALEYHKKYIPYINAAMTEMFDRIDKQTLVVASKIIFENYGKLKNKQDRARNFIDLYNEEMRKWRELSIEEQCNKLDEDVKALSELVGEPLKWRESGGGVDDKDVG